MTSHPSALVISQLSSFETKQTDDDTLAALWFQEVISPLSSIACVDHVPGHAYVPLAVAVSSSKPFSSSHTPAGPTVAGGSNQNRICLFQSLHHPKRPPCASLNQRHASPILKHIYSTMQLFPSPSSPCLCLLPGSRLGNTTIACLEREKHQADSQGKQASRRSLRVP